MDQTSGTDEQSPDFLQNRVSKKLSGVGVNVAKSTHDRSPGQDDIEEEKVSESVSETVK